MKLNRLLLLAFVIIFVAALNVFADDDHDDKHYNNREKHIKTSSTLNLVKDELYLKECGACHFAYQPELLPARSWKKMMGSLDKHFGTDASLGQDSQDHILKYLTKESAESSSARKAVKMLNSIQADETPSRISEVRYFKKEHRKISADTLKRKSIGSISNCTACHTTADKGEYDEDLVSIPKK